jgi:hypothetical protein
MRIAASSPNIIFSVCHSERSEESPEYQYYINIYVLRVVIAYRKRQGHGLKDKEA